MAMNSGALSALMQAKLTTAFGPTSGDEDAKRVAMCNALAEAIVEHLAANADVRITSSTAGLQRDPASSDPTLAPASDVVISGALE
jgi:hypothetical protein